MRFLNKLYTLYAVGIFLAFMCLLFPFYFLVIQVKPLRRYSHVLNKIWGRSFSILALLPFKCEFRHKLDRDRQYIFCANHFSYFDIASMVFTPFDFQYTGKISLVKTPIFGYIFKNLHITVDRYSETGRKEALQKYAAALDEGKSLIIFPEGGIKSENPPYMGAFKNGPFITAIEKKTPIVPVTIPFNWIILPDTGKYRLRRHPSKVIYHAPVDVEMYSADDVEKLRDKVFNIIQDELLKQNNYENRPGNASQNSAFGQT